MTDLSHSLNKNKIEAAAEEFIDATSPWVARLARAGYAAKGVVYCLIGALAVLAAMSNGGATTGQRGALHKLLEQPFGQVMLAAIAFGLAGYAVWCFIQAVEDPEHTGDSPKALTIRAGRFARGLIYGSLVFAAAGMISGTRPGAGEERTQEWTAWVMSFPLGLVIVALVGVGVVVYGLYQLYRAWRVKLDSQLDLHRLSRPVHRAVIYISRFGMAARGVVFVIIGSFLVIAARHSNPAEAKGLGEALRYVQGQPYGPWLLAATAAGLIAYGIYELVRARYRRIHAG